MTRLDLIDVFCCRRFFSFSFSVSCPCRPNSPNPPQLARTSRIRHNSSPVHLNLLARRTLSGPGPGLILTDSRHSDFPVRPSVLPSAYFPPCCAVHSIRLYIQPVPVPAHFVFVFCVLSFVILTRRPGIYIRKYDILKNFGIWVFDIRYFFIFTSSAPPLPRCCLPVRLVLNSHLSSPISHLHLNYQSTTTPDSEHRTPTVV